jgi:hypothetical protein
MPLNIAIGKDNAKVQPGRQPRNILRAPFVDESIAIGQNKDIQGPAELRLKATEALKIDISLGAGQGDATGSAFTFDAGEKDYVLIGEGVWSIDVKAI